VLPANNAKEAMRVEAKFAGTIDLLLSDVRMPGMSGPDLAKGSGRYSISLVQGNHSARRCPQATCDNLQRYITGAQTRRNCEVELVQACTG
jgi:DNA-binding NtrC family response regulator